MYEHTWGLLSNCIMQESIVAWPASIRQWERFHGRKQQCPQRAAQGSTAPLRGRGLLPLPHRHPEGLLDRQPSLCLGSSCQGNLTFFPLVWAQLCPSAPSALPSPVKALEASLSKCITPTPQTTEQSVQTPNVALRVPSQWALRTDCGPLDAAELNLAESFSGWLWIKVDLCLISETHTN